MKFHLPLIVSLLLAVAGLLDPADGRPAQEGDDLNEIINGFDGDDVAGEDLDDLIRGFDPDTAATEDSGKEDAEDLLDGFEDEDQTRSAVDAASAAPSSTWSLKGNFTLTTVYNYAHDAPAPGQTDWRGLSMLRPELDLELEKKLSAAWKARIGIRAFYDLAYSLRGRDRYTSQVLENDEQELELRDTFIQGRLTDRLDAKIGRQIVVWGTLDSLRVTDVLNPLDLRLPGLVDVEDLRLPVTMARFDYYFDRWSISALAIPEARFNKLPAYGSDFYPSPVPLPPEEKPSDTQWAAAISGVFSGWDVGFYGAGIYQSESYIAATSDSTASQVRQYTRISMIGVSVNIARGNWLWKAEAAGLDGLAYTTTPDERYTRFDLGAGVEYSGLDETDISLEAVNRHLLDYDERLERPPDEKERNEFQWALRVVRDFWNDTLTLTLLAQTLGIQADDGALERLEARYAVTDNIAVRGGVVLYQSGDKGRFKNLGDNDRLFVELKYSF